MADALRAAGDREQTIRFAGKHASETVAQPLPREPQFHAPWRASAPSELAGLVGLREGQAVLSWSSIFLLMNF